MIFSRKFLCLLKWDRQVSPLLPVSAGYWKTFARMEIPAGTRFPGISSVQELFHHGI